MDDTSRLPHRPLGQTGLNVSLLGLGTVKFGRNEGVKYPSGFEIPEDNVLADLLARARDLGINTLDTAPAYGESEERLGRLLKGQRDQWVIVGKAGEEFENGHSTFDFSPAHIRASLERTLKRLQTDRLDVLMIHSDGNDELLIKNEELYQTLLSFKARGLVRGIGISTKTVEGGLATLEAMDAVMCTYHPDYTTEKPVLDKAHRLGKGALVKKALASGHTANPETALRFAAAHPGVSSIVVGTINPSHLEKNAKALIQAMAASGAQG